MLRPLLLPLWMLILLAGCSTKAGQPGTVSLSQPAERYLKAIRTNDEPLSPAQPGDWLGSHAEAGQRFGDYRQAHPRRLGEKRQIIYLLPLGRFSAGPDSLLIAQLRDYLSICFQRPVRLLPAAEERLIPDSLRRGRDGSVQLHSGFIVEQLLPRMLPEDGLSLMAVSQKDLYPAADWNYVFGQASYRDRVGVASLYRLRGPAGDSLGQQRCLERLLKTASHEIGHMLWLPHCIEGRCLMNGSNNLPEADRQPLRPCSQCQRKLWWRLGYDPGKRAAELQQFLERHGLTAAAGEARRDLLRWSEK